MINNNIKGDKKKERKERAEQEVMERGRITPLEENLLLPSI